MATRCAKRIPPVLLTVIFAILMWTVSAVTPELDVPLPTRAMPAVAFAVAGLLVMSLALKGFREERTSVNPLDLTRTSAVVTSGIYRRSRNPMYLAMLLGLVHGDVYSATRSRWGSPFCSCQPSLAFR